jgi:hypothetical protein
LIKVYFERSRGIDETKEFATVDAFHCYLDVLEKENAKDPYRRRQFWKARDPETRTILARWEPGERKWKIDRVPGAESPLW